MNYIRGIDLDETERAKIKAAFIHRDTVEHPWNSIAREYCYSPLTMANCATDKQWIEGRAFTFDKLGEVIGCLILASLPASQVHERSQYGEA
jgi:hypothetical protein